MVIDKTNSAYICIIRLTKLNFTKKKRQKFWPSPTSLKLEKINFGQVEAQTESPSILKQ